MKYLRMLRARGYWKPAGEDESGSGGGGSDQNEETEVLDADKSKAAPAKKDEEGEKARQFSDDEAAELLKENVRRKKEQRRLAEELEAARTQLKQFEGVDLDEVKKLVSERQAAEEDRLKKSGEWDRLKAQMAEAHTREKQALAEQNKLLAEQTSQLQTTITELTIGNSFANSEYIHEDLLIPPNKARVIYGSHFEFQDGRVVGFDKPSNAKDRTVLVDGSGDPLDFEAALKKIIQADPDYARIAKSKLRTGANSNTKGSDKSPEVKAEVRGVSRIAAGLSKAAK